MSEGISQKEFSQIVQEARKALGFKTAKEFHRDKNSILSISYESYSNVESGRALPSADKLNLFIDALEIKDIKNFVYNYCNALMPTPLLKSFFKENEGSPRAMHVPSEGYANYKEKFQALLEFNRIQSKYELTNEQLSLMESDLICWDIVNFFISREEEGLECEEIALKTGESVENTLKRIELLIKVGILKKLENGKYLASQYAYIIPRKASGVKFTHLLVDRELQKTFTDKKNSPYTRFRFLSLKPDAREKIEALIDNLILDCRQLKSVDEGKPHYLQVLFSDRQDL